MDDSTEKHPDETQMPTIGGAMVFRAKATLLQVNRAARNLLAGKPTRLPIDRTPSELPLIGESTAPLWTNSNDSERHLLAGKVHNLRLAIRRLNGLNVPAGELFSFWAQIGRASRWKGYVEGRELREGCIIPAVGGGLCQLSSALYDAALRAGLEIVERHAHSEVVPGSLAELGRDATVFWNYVDLRFRSTHAFRIEAAMDAHSLTIRIRGRAAASPKQVPVVLKSMRAAGAGNAPQSCTSCGVQDCFRNVRPNASRRSFGRTAYVVDEYWPEFDNYIRATRQEDDLLLLPLDGNRFGKPNYAWSTEGFHQVRQSPVVALLRAYQSRKLATQGAARQRTLLAFHERLASSYAGGLTHEVTHVTVAQSLLPFLWRSGHLGGRTFDVLMTALPLGRLHERLDLAAALHPESKTLADFRADDWLVGCESEALQHAHGIITPHSELAGLYKDRTTVIDWVTPPRKSPLDPTNGDKRRIVFPAATVARKGAYELRAAIEGLDLRLWVTGTQLEGRKFWQGAAVEIDSGRSGNGDWLNEAAAVVLPAFVEHRPRRLLEALARGIPVIASTACGLENIPGVRSVPVGDVAALRTEIKRVLSRAR